MAKKITQRKVVLVSFLVNLLDVITNLVVAVLTGSAVVFGQMAQGIADGVGSALLVLGARRAARPSDARHPLGYAREAFFWSLLSAVAMLVFGAGMSAWRGFQQLMDPKPLDTPLLAVAVLVLAVFTNGYAVGLSARKLEVGRLGLRKVMQSVNQPLVKGAFIRDVIGTFTQYPIRLAWAITIHKSQGKTFERAVIDLGRGAFAHGQTYVALSRCRRLGGITLKKPIRPRDIMVDERIVEYYEMMRRYTL